MTNAFDGLWYNSKKGIRKVKVGRLDDGPEQNLSVMVGDNQGKIVGYLTNFPVGLISGPIIFFLHS